MRIDFGQPLWLLAFPVGAAAVLWIDMRYKARGRALRRCVTRAVRLLVVLLLAMALAVPSIYTGSNVQSTWILLDASASMGAAQGEAERAAVLALESLDRGREAGVIAFGRDAMVESPLSAAPRFSGLKTAIDASATDVAAALRLAGAMIPEDSAGRIALVSDGRIGDAQAEAALLGARGISIDALLLMPGASRDAQVSRVDVPSHVYQNQQFHVTVRIDATEDMSGTLVLSANRQPVSTREVSLRRGENTFVFQDVANVSGVVTYEAQLICEGDSISQNDRLGAFLAVEGVPSVLVVEGGSGAGNELCRMLRATGMAVETMSPGALPDHAEALRKYDAIVLANVDEDALPGHAAAILKQSVRTLGRGVVVVGGDSSYALGDYRGSELEEMLPVTIDVKNLIDQPPVALMLVIDKSGSMSEQMLGVTRLDLAKEGAARSVEVLTERDSVGVIEFDDAAKWVVKLAPAKDIPAIQSRIGSIRPGGGTAFFSPLYEAYEALRQYDAPIKHVIFLTDGEPADSGFDTIADAMISEGITLSTVGVGTGANTKLLGDLAERGGGRSYVAGELDNIPKIFTKETMLISASYVQNRRFTPSVAEESPLTDYAGFPMLDGYLVTALRPLATASMVSDRDDPLLAWWQYGAGRVLCWMSDTEGAWTRGYLGWDQGPSFFSGLVAQVLPETGQSGSLSAIQEQDHVRILYQQPDGAAANATTTRAIVLAPDGTEQEILLMEQSPGVYGGSLTSTAQGAYAIRVEQEADGQLLRSLEGGLVKPYPSEFDLTAHQDGTALARLSEATGGQVLTDAAQLLSGRAKPVRAGRQIDGALLWAALIMLLLDIALRRLAWDRAVIALWDRRRGAQTRREEPAAKPRRVETGTPAPTTQNAPTDTADALLQKRAQRKKL